MLYRTLFFVFLAVLTLGSANASNTPQQQVFQLLSGDQPLNCTNKACYFFDAGQRTIYAINPATGGRTDVIAEPMLLGRTFTATQNQFSFGTLSGGALDNALYMATYAKDLAGLQLPPNDTSMALSIIKFDGTVQTMFQGNSTVVLNGKTWYIITLYGFVSTNSRLVVLLAALPNPLTVGGEIHYVMVDVGPNGRLKLLGDFTNSDPEMYFPTGVTTQNVWVISGPMSHFFPTIRDISLGRVDSTGRLSLLQDHIEDPTGAKSDRQAVNYTFNLSDSNMLEVVLKSSQFSFLSLNDDNPAGTTLATVASVGGKTISAIPGFWAASQNDIWFAATFSDGSTALCRLLNKQASIVADTKLLQADASGVNGFGSTPVAVTTLSGGISIVKRNSYALRFPALAADKISGQIGTLLDIPGTDCYGKISATLNGKNYAANSDSKGGISFFVPSDAGLAAGVPYTLTFQIANDLGNPAKLGIELNIERSVTDVTPRIDSITNAGKTFSDSTGLVVAPGEYIMLSGANFAGNATVAGSDALPTQLDITTVTVDGRPIPLSYVSPTQINAQVPWDLGVGGPVSIQVSRSGNAPAASKAIQATVVASDPGLFMLNQNSQLPIIQLLDGSIANEVNTLKPDTYITMYGTGFGYVDANIQVGIPTPTDQLYTCPCQGDVRLVINGQDADVLWVGLTPGSIGLFQINAHIPAGIQLPPHNPDQPIGAVSAALIVRGNSVQQLMFPF